METSLQKVGFDLSDPRVALVETAFPQRKPYSSVLAQNAWNLIPRDQFVELLRPYPSAMRARICARRAVARLNLRRADRVVCLTRYMAGLAAEHGCQRVVVVPCSLPMQILEYDGVQRQDVAGREPFALVPGTVTWYKDPLTALVLLENLGTADLGRVIFAGAADASGCLEAVKARGIDLGIEVLCQTFGQMDLFDLYSQADVVVIPSRLESLGFGLAEALYLNAEVFASAIPAHVEVARLVGREPTWLGQEDEAPHVPASHTDIEVVKQWLSVGEALGLARKL